VVRTYAPVGHRHLAELVQEFGLDPEHPGLHFSITAVGIVRGALATCHCLLHDDLEERDVWKMYRDEYGDEPFVRLVRARRGIHRYPEPKLLAGANYCDVGFAADPAGRRLVVVAAIDNLMKGAAGNAVQTMNVMYGWRETLGLEFPGLHPI
jgi:N-acetyl-gamma-glutamyl-phosphate/LysW-gamma-L-alpha-aminoadipyl-6-phosphate reductase